MSKAQLVITAVVLEGRAKAKSPATTTSPANGSNSCANATQPRATRPMSPAHAPAPQPAAITVEVEDRIVRLRKTLTKRGLDAGADTIAAHLATDPSITNVPAISTIWRILKRRGFVTPQPTNAPDRPGNASTPSCPTNAGKPTPPTGTSLTAAAQKSSTSSTTTPDWPSPAWPGAPSPAPTSPTTFTTAFTTWGPPASVLTDNGAIFTGQPRRGGRTALEITLGTLGINTSLAGPTIRRPAAKVERFHQTQKKWLTAHPARHHRPAPTPLLDEFTRLLQHSAPTPGHRQTTPIQAYNARPKATPTGYVIPAHCRVRTDTIDAAGVITIRYNSRLHHIGLGKRRTGTKVTVLIDDRDIRVLDRDTGQLIRKLVLDPTRDYQPRGVKCGNSPENRLKV